MEQTLDNAVLDSHSEVKLDLFLETLRTFGEAKLAVTGASMLPAIWPGDVLLVRSQDAAEALPGDIVLFGRAGRLVAHRVVERTTSAQGIEWVTRGDCVEGNDPPVSCHELLGRVTAIERGSRRVNPRRTFWGRIGAAILSRSALCTRAVLWMRKRRGSGLGI